MPKDDRLHRCSGCHRVVGTFVVPYWRFVSNSEAMHGIRFVHLPKIICRAKALLPIGTCRYLLLFAAAYTVTGVAYYV